MALLTRNGALFNKTNVFSQKIEGFKRNKALFTMYTSSAEDSKTKQCQARMWQECHKM